MPDGYVIQCFNCLSDFDAVEAIWCSCNPQHPSKVCPFCLGCFCAAGQEFKDAFWKGVPPTLLDEVNTLSQSRMLIGEMLVRAGLIGTSQLLEALTQQKVDGRRLGEILVDSGALPAERLEKFLQSQHTVTSVDLTRARVDAMMLRRLGVDQCLKEKILPLEAEAFRDRHIMTLAMADPSNTGAVELVMRATGYQVIPGVAPADAITSVIRSIFPQGSATPIEASSGTRIEAAQHEESAACRKLLAAALKRRASHVTIQQQGGVTKVFYRIDGALYLDRARHAADPGASLSSFKMVAGLQGEPGSAQRSGRALVTLDGLEYPIIVRRRTGADVEELSVKILDPVSFPPRLDDLGLPAQVVERLRAALEKDSGLIIISAPPLSGATSTLYALLMEIGSQGRSLALVESPRAVSLTDAFQAEFFPEIKGSFDEAVDRASRSGARALAIAAWEGVSWAAGTNGLSERMLVIGKVEAQAPAEALLKLAAAGYPPRALAARPSLLLHQWLVRRVCSTCRAEAGTAQEHAASLGLPLADARRLKVWRGAGCDDCGPTPGFRGRLPLARAFRVTPAVADAVATGSLQTVAAACRAAGLASLRMEAVAALTAGLTTPEEVTRI